MIMNSETSRRVDEITESRTKSAKSQLLSSEHPPQASLENFTHQSYIAIARGSKHGVVTLPQAARVFGIEKPTSLPCRVTAWPRKTFGYVEYRPECHAACLRGAAALQVLRSLAGLLVEIQDTVTEVGTRKRTDITFHDFDNPPFGTPLKPALLNGRLDMEVKHVAQNTVSRPGRLQHRALPANISEEIWNEHLVPLLTNKVGSDWQGLGVGGANLHRFSQRRIDNKMARRRIKSCLFTVLARSRAEPSDTVRLSFVIDDQSHQIKVLQGSVTDFLKILFDNFGCAGACPMSITARTSSSLQKNELTTTGWDGPFFQLSTTFEDQVGRNHNTLKPYPAYVNILTSLADPGQAPDTDMSVRNLLGILMPGSFRFPGFSDEMSEDDYPDSSSDEETRQLPIWSPPDTSSDEDMVDANVHF